MEVIRWKNCRTPNSALLFTKESDSRLTYIPKTKRTAKGKGSRNYWTTLQESYVCLQLKFVVQTGCCDETISFTVHLKWRLGEVLEVQLILKYHIKGENNTKLEQAISFVLIRCIASILLRVSKLSIHWKRINFLKTLLAY